MHKWALRTNVRYMYVALPGSWREGGMSTCTYSIRLCPTTFDYTRVCLRLRDNVRRSKSINANYLLGRAEDEVVEDEESSSNTLLSISCEGERERGKEGGRMEGEREREREQQRATFSQFCILSLLQSFPPSSMTIIMKAYKPKKFSHKHKKNS